MFGMDMDLSGLFAGLDKLFKVTEEAALRGVFAGGEVLRADAVAIVPFDRGFNGGLAGSASTQPAGLTNADEVESIVGFNMPYAAKMHEDMTLHINQRWASGQPRQQKYLETPMKQNAQKYGKIIADTILQTLGS